MAFDFGKLKKSVTDAANTAVKTAQEKMPESIKNSEAANSVQGWMKKADDIAKSVQEQLPESIKDIDVKASIKDMAVKGTQAVARVQKLIRLLLRLSLNRKKNI